MYCGQTVGRIQMKLGTQVGLGPGHIMLDGDQLLPQRGTAPPQFLAHIYCGQMAEWIKMPLGMGVGLGPGDFVLYGDQLLQKRGHSHPQFLAHVCCGEMPGLIKMPLGTEVGLGPGHTVLDGDPGPAPKRGTAPNFRPMSIVAKRSPNSATAEHV